MKLNELTLNEIQSVKPSTTIQAAAITMKTEGVRLLSVRDEDTTPLGIVTERDLALWVLVDNVSPETPLSALVSSVDYSVSADPNLQNALQLMKSQRVSHVIICDSNGQSHGLLSLCDAENTNQGIPIIVEPGTNQAPMFQPPATPGGWTGY